MVSFRFYQVISTGVFSLKTKVDSSVSICTLEKPKDLIRQIKEVGMKVGFHSIFTIMVIRI